MIRLLLVSFILAAAGLHISMFGTKQLKPLQFRKKYNSCLTSSGVDFNKALRSVVGLVENDPKLKKFLFCANKQNGFQNANGVFNQTMIRNNMTTGLATKEPLDQIIEMCARSQYGPEDNAYMFLKCSYDIIMGVNKRTLAQQLST